MYSHGTLSELKGNGIEKENEWKSLLRYAKTQNIKDWYQPKPNSESKNLQKNVDKLSPIGVFLACKPKIDAH